VTKQKADTLSIVRPPTRLGQHGADIDGFNAAALLAIRNAEPLQLLLGNRHRVRDNELAETAVLEYLYRLAGEDAVCDKGNDVLSSVLDKRIGSFGECATSISHIVHEDGRLVAHVAYQRHAGNLVGSLSLLVDEGKGKVESVCHARCSLGTSGIRTDNYTVNFPPLALSVFVFHSSAVANVDQILPYPFHGRRLGVKIINRYIEEALDLRGVQIHRDDVITAGSLEHIGHELRGDGRAGLVFLVLACVWEVGEDGGDAACGGGFAGVDHDQQFHQAIVDIIWASGLEDKDYIGERGQIESRDRLALASKGRVWNMRRQDKRLTIFIANRFAYSYTGLLIRILQDHDFGKLDTQSALSHVSKCSGMG
jgi:hypothetical protein